MKLTIIGCGGVGLRLVRELSENPFKNISRIKVYDGDTVEEKNLERQKFLPDLIGVNKAKAALETYKIEGATAHPYDWTSLETPEDITIIATDNIESRLLLLDQIDNSTNDPLLISAANADISEGMGVGSTSWAYKQDWKDNPHADPRIRSQLGEIESINQTQIDAGRPCSDSSEPQTGLANAGACQRALELMVLWMSDLPEQYKPLESRFELRQSESIFFDKVKNYEETIH
tara:strand:- start:710 stop:1405 length:696 start_codon:yes stop_codon:yes gene_type:complete